jgi:Nif-specific regulatory protein
VTKASVLAHSAAIPSSGRVPQAGPAPELLLAAAEVGRELASQGDIELRLTQALCALERRLGATRSVLYRADNVNRTLRVEAAHGIALDQLGPRYGSGVAGRVAESCQPIVVPVVRHDPMALSELRDLSRWSEPGWNLIAVPVVGSGAKLGVLCAYFRHRDSAGFGERLGVLEVVASLLLKAMLPDTDLTQTRAGNAQQRAAAPAPSPETLYEYANMIGASAAMRQIYEQVSQVARTNATALLRGESGTGKELVAHAIHRNSPRAEMPFVKVNCAALPESLFESEVFGHERGAFTGAHSRKKGRFELAQGGTLFLDEIGELTLTTQAKLLRVLQFREFERLGGTETLRTDVRIVAATNADMERAIAAGTFREDLYYRINIFTITVPPLRDRRADIPQLAEYFLRRLAAEHGRKIARISNGALECLTQHTWPGNVRELENVIERAVVVCQGAVVRETHLPDAVRVPNAMAAPLSLAQAVARLERELITQAIEAAGGNIAAAARALGTTERVVRYKVQKLGIDALRFRP